MYIKKETREIVELYFIASFSSSSGATPRLLVWSRQNHNRKRRSRSSLFFYNTGVCLACVCPQWTAGGTALHGVVGSGVHFDPVE